MPEECPCGDTRMVEWCPRHGLIGTLGGQLRREYRVNDPEGIHGPYDQERAELVYGALVVLDRPTLRSPHIESREVGPWIDEDFGE